MSPGTEPSVERTQARVGLLFVCSLLCAAVISGCSALGYGLGASIDGQRKRQAEFGQIEIGDAVEFVGKDGRRLDGNVVDLSADSVHIVRPRMESLVRVRGAVDERIAKKDLEHVWIRGRPGNFAAAGVMLGLYGDFLVLQALDDRWYILGPLH